LTVQTGDMVMLMTVERYEFRLTRLEEEVRELRRNQVETSKGLNDLADFMKKHQDLLITNHRAIVDLEQVMLTLTNDVQALSVKVDQNHIAMEGYIDRRLDSFEAAVNQRFDKVDKHFDKVDQRFEKVESDVSCLKADVSDLKSDMSDVKSDIAEIKTLLKEKLV
ncbi:MAG: hypothetical protein RM811_018905, partial [Endozoicomonas sp.]